MSFGDKLKKVKKTTTDDSIIKKDIKKRTQDYKIYTFMTKREDEEIIEDLITKSNMSVAEFMRDCIEKAHNVKMVGDYKNTGRRGK